MSAIRQGGEEGCTFGEAFEKSDVRMQRLDCPGSGPFGQFGNCNLPSRVVHLRSGLPKDVALAPNFSFLPVLYFRHVFRFSCQGD